MQGIDTIPAEDMVESSDISTNSMKELRTYILNLGGQKNKEFRFAYIVGYAGEKSTMPADDKEKISDEDTNHRIAFAQLTHREKKWVILYHGSDPAVNASVAYTTAVGSSGIMRYLFTHEWIDFDNDNWVAFDVLLEHAAQISEDPVYERVRLTECLQASIPLTTYMLGLKELPADKVERDWLWEVLQAEPTAIADFTLMAQLQLDTLVAEKYKESIPCNLLDRKAKLIEECIKDGEDLDLLFIFALANGSNIILDEDAVRQTGLIPRLRADILNILLDTSTLGLYCMCTYIEDVLKAYEYKPSVTFLIRTLASPSIASQIFEALLKCQKITQDDWNEIIMIIINEAPSTLDTFITLAALHANISILRTCVGQLRYYGVYDKGKFQDILNLAYNRREIDTWDECIEVESFEEEHGLQRDRLHAMRKAKVLEESIKKPHYNFPHGARYGNIAHIHACLSDEPSNGNILNDYYIRATQCVGKYHVKDTEIDFHFSKEDILEFEREHGIIYDGIGHKEILKRKLKYDYSYDAGIHYANLSYALISALHSKNFWVIGMLVFSHTTSLFQIKDIEDSSDMVKFLKNAYQKQIESNSKINYEQYLDSLYPYIYQGINSEDDERWWELVEASLSEEQHYLVSYNPYLLLAIKYERNEFVELWLDMHDFRLTNTFRNQLLECAKRCGNKEAARIIQSRSLTKTLPVNYETQFVVECQKSGDEIDIELVRMCLEDDTKGANYISKFHKLFTKEELLVFAIKNNNIPLTKLLLDLKPEWCISFGSLKEIPTEIFRACAQDLVTWGLHNANASLLSLILQHASDPIFSTIIMPKDRPRRWGIREFYDLFCAIITKNNEKMTKYGLKLLDNGSGDAKQAMITNPTLMTAEIAIGMKSGGYRRESEWWKRTYYCTTRACREKVHNEVGVGEMEKYGIAALKAKYIKDFALEDQDRFFYSECQKEDAEINKDLIAAYIKSGVDTRKKRLFNSKEQTPLEYALATNKSTLFTSLYSTAMKAREGTSGNTQGAKLAPLPKLFGNVAMQWCNSRQ